jgi:hypothetical protein
MVAGDESNAPKRVGRTAHLPQCATLREPKTVQPTLSRVGVMGLICAILAVLLAGCTFPWTKSCNLGNDTSGIPLCPLTANYLDGRFEAHLYYPGAAVIKRDLHDEITLTLNPASIATTLSVKAAQTALQTWYTSMLVARGWTVSASVRPPDFAFYRRPRENFDVVFNEQTGATTQFTIVYQIRSGGWR